MMFESTPVFRPPEKVDSGSNEPILTPFLDEIITSFTANRDFRATGPTTTSSNQENDNNGSPLLNITALHAAKDSRPFFLKDTNDPASFPAGCEPATRTPFTFVPLNAPAKQCVESGATVDVDSGETEDSSKTSNGESNDLEDLSSLRCMAAIETYPEKYFKGLPSNAGRYPFFCVKRLSDGFSGEHGKTSIVRLASSGPGGRKEILAFLKRVSLARMGEGCADLDTYARLCAAKDLEIDESVKKFRAFVTDLDGLHEDPEECHIDFIFGLYQCDLLTVLDFPEVYGTRHRLKLWAAQGIGGLAYLHSIGIIHRDVKPANILVDSRGNLCITDFDLCHVSPTAEKLDYDGKYSSSHCGTPRYMAPEVDACDDDGIVMLGRTPRRYLCYGPKVDFFSFGIVLYELAWTAYNSDLKPVEDNEDDHLEYKEKLRRKSLRAIVAMRMDVHEGFAPMSEFYELLEWDDIGDRCLQELLAQLMDPNVATRPDFSEIVSSPWFEGRGSNNRSELVRAFNPFKHLVEYCDSLDKTEYPIPEEQGEDVLGDEAPEYTAKAYLHSRETERRRTWINVDSEVFNFINSVET